MTDDQLDPRFERAVRGSLAELEPGSVPASLQVAVTAVPRRVPRRQSSGRLQLLAAMGAAAAAVVVALAVVGLVDRLATPTTPVAASPSLPVNVPALAAVLQFVLEPDDAGADLDAVAGVLRVRLAAAGFDDAVVEVEGHRIVADVTVDPADEGLAKSAERLLTAPGIVQAFATGSTVWEDGQDIFVALPVLFHGGDVTEARVQDDPATLTLTLDADGAERFGEFSSTHVGESFAIALDGVVVIAPSINEAITDGMIEVSGIDSPDGVGILGARELAAILESGPLPAAVRLAADGPSPEPAPPTASPDPSAAPTIAPVDPSSLRYVCGQFPFPAALLDEHRLDERADTPEAAALRAHLAMVGPDYDWLPDDGWALVGADDVGAEYVTTRNDGTVVYATLSSEGGWRVDGWGDCQPRMVLDGGIGPATWALAPGQDVGPETTTFEALVTEQACSGAQPADGRIVGPDIIAVGDSVLVTFGVRVLEGDQTCPGNPSTRVTVTLPEPLGDRQLLDGSTLPRSLVPTDSPQASISTVEGITVLAISGAIVEACGSLGRCDYEVEVIGPDGTTRRDLVPTPNGALVPDGTLLTVNPGGSYTVRFVGSRVGGYGGSDPDDDRQGVPFADCSVTVGTTRPESFGIHVEFGSSSCQVERDPVW